MKNSSKAIIGVIAFIIIAVLVASYMMGQTTSTTADFWENAGVVFYADETEKQDAITKLGSTDYVDGGDYIIIPSKCNYTKIVVDLYVVKGYKNNRLVCQASFNRTDAEFAIIQKLIGMEITQNVDDGKGGVTPTKVKVITDYDVTDPNEGSLFSDVLYPLLMVGLGLFIIILFIRQAKTGGAGGALDFGKTKAQVITNIKVRFSDVAGAEEEKQELQEVVEFLKHPQKFAALGARTPKGVLLVGNPGTGKTLFAKAVAGEANVPFYSISGSDFVEMFVGVGASRVRDLFNTAKHTMPCIIFIDEIDAVGRQRGAGLGGGNDEREQTLNQLLVQMDGFESSTGIVVIAATNRADVLDPALLRPGRFDRTIYVNMPDVKGREAILKVHARNKPVAPDVNFKVIARLTSGFSGADLANLLNEAAILAVRKDRKFITNEDIYEGVNKVLLGPQKKSRLITETDKRITAYHESGHAILACLLPNCDKVHEVSIIPRGMAGGYTMTRPDNDDNYISKSKLLDDMVMTMGGRAAEEIIIHEVTSGPSADITQVTKYARKMVTEWGMNEGLGPVCYGTESEIFIGRDYQTKENYSEDTAKTIDEEIRKLANNAYKKAVELLTANKDKLDTMAKVLLEKETIYTDEVKMIMDGKSLEEIISHIDNRETGNPFDRMTGDNAENVTTQNVEEKKE